MEFGYLCVGRGGYRGLVNWFLVDGPGDAHGPVSNFLGPGCLRGVLCSCLISGAPGVARGLVGDFLASYTPCPPEATNLRRLLGWVGGVFVFQLVPLILNGSVSVTAGVPGEGVIE